MAGSPRLALVLAVVASLAAAVSGCGGSGDATTAAGATSATEGTTASQAGGGQGSSAPAKSGGGKSDRQSGGEGSGSAGSDEGAGGSGSGNGKSASGGSKAGSGGSQSGGSGSGSSGSGSGDFGVPGGDNSVQEFGDEASAEERAQASQMLQTYMKAREAEDQAGACASLSKAALAQLQELAKAVPEVEPGDSCVKIFTVIDRRTPPSARANTMTGPIASLRVEGNRGFALYHGTENTDYTIQMDREGGVWKVGALVPFSIG